MGGFSKTDGLKPFVFKDRTKDAWVHSFGQINASSDVIYADGFL